MQLNISRNTVIATPIVEEHIVAALKAKYNNILFVEVDFMNKAKVKDVDFFKAPDPADLHDMLYDLAYFAVVTRGRYDWYNDEFEWLEKVFTEYENQVPDFIVFRLVNWEPHLMIAPFGRLDRLAIISYFLDYYLSFMYFDATTYKAFGFFGNYHSFFDIANSFRGNHFLILSKPQSTLLC